MLTSGEWSSTSPPTNREQKTSSNGEWRLFNVANEVEGAMYINIWNISAGGGGGGAEIFAF